MLKRLPLFLFFFLFLFFSSCDTIKQIAGSLPPSDFEMAAGLKDALSQGLYKGFNDFADPNSGNPLMRFALPGEAAKIEKTLRDLGLSSLVNQVTEKFTTAMASAVKSAQPIFIEAVRDLTLRDAAGLLLTDNLHAATDHFKSVMAPQLMKEFRPIVDSTANLNGANREWTRLAETYNSIPLISRKLEPTLTDYIAARGIDAMFASVAKEEENIRTKYDFRKTDMMKRVFTYAEQEMQRRKTGTN